MMSKIVILSTELISTAVKLDETVKVIVRMSILLGNILEAIYSF